MFNVSNYIWSLWKSADGTSFTEVTVTGNIGGDAYGQGHAPPLCIGDGFVVLAGAAGGTLISLDVADETQATLTFGSDTPISSATFANGAVATPKFWTGYVACAET